jgi:hypothetical protein
MISLLGIFFVFCFSYIVQFYFFLSENSAGKEKRTEEAVPNTLGNLGQAETDSEYKMNFYLISVKENLVCLGSNTFLKKEKEKIHDMSPELVSAIS